jgi:site-specific DNA-methyltransferase (adenine-specific)
MSLREKRFKRDASDVRLFHGDCVKGIRDKLDAGSVDVVVTSPPYNIGVKYSRYQDKRSQKDYLQWLGEWADEVKRVLKDDGSFFLNMGAKPSAPWLPFDVAGVMRKRFELQNVIHWIKSISIEKEDVGNYGMIAADISIGHFKPIQSKRFLNDCQEYLFHFTKTGKTEIARLAIGVPYQDKSNVSRWKTAKDDVRCRGNTWFVPYKTIRSRKDQRPHPATFPVELARKAIALHGARPGLVVLDPFLGIGHAGAAAVRCKADFVGFEIDEEYFSEAARLIQAEAQFFDQGCGSAADQSEDSAIED